MRKSRLRLLALFLVCLGCAANTTTTRNVTYHTSPTEGDLDGFSSALSALDEPAFCSPLSRDVEAYRFLWIRTFHPTVLIDVTMRSDTEA